MKWWIAIATGLMLAGCGGAGDKPAAPAKPAAPVAAKPVDMAAVVWKGEAGSGIVPLLTDKAKPVVLKQAGNGRWEIPAGDYQFTGYSYSLDGRTATVKAVPEGGRKVSVTADKPLEFGAVGAVKSVVTIAKQADGSINLGIVSTAADGSQIYCKNDEGQPPSLTQVRVTDAAGKVVLNGKIEFG